MLLRLFVQDFKIHNQLLVELLANFSIRAEKKPLRHCLRNPSILGNSSIPGIYESFRRSGIAAQKTAAVASKQPGAIQSER